MPGEAAVRIAGDTCVARPTQARSTYTRPSVAETAMLPHIEVIGMERGKSGRPLRATIVGCGLIGTFHSFMLGLVARNGHLPLQLGHVYDVDRERSAKFQGWGWEVASSLEEALVDADLVWVCVPTAEHLRIVEAAVEMGVKGIFCEKPLGRNLAEARKVLLAANGKPLQVGLVLRTTPPFRIAKSTIETGLLGKLQSIVFRDDQHVPIRGMYRSTWRKDPRIAGSGVLLEHSIHDVDLIEWLGGPVAWCVGKVMHRIPIDDAIEDAAVALLGTRDGPVSTLTTVWHNVDRRTSNRRVEIFGTEGVITIEHEITGPVILDLRDRRDVYSGSSLVAKMFEIERPWFGESDPLQYVCNEDARFVRSVLEGTPPSPSGEDALRAHEIVDAVYTSSREGGREVALAQAP